MGTSVPEEGSAGARDLHLLGEINTLTAVGGHVGISRFSEGMPEQTNQNWLWMATDALGHVAIFQSMGIAAVPSSLLSVLEHAEVVDEFVDKELLSLYPVTDGHLSNSVHTHSWFRSFSTQAYAQNWNLYTCGIMQFASRGFYVYDPTQHKIHGGGYFQAGYPIDPVLITDLPLSIQKIINCCSFPLIHFLNRDFISNSEIEIT